jgi:imidazolonepropionase-like amidohydrolase
MTEGEVSPVPEVLTAPRVMTGDQTVTLGAVVVGAQTVDWVGQAGALPAEYADLPRTDYPGSTIMPGLIDSHVHLAFAGGPDPVGQLRRESDERLLVLMLRNARDLLGVGVTIARDLGARSYLDVVVRDAVAAGLARGPRLVVAGRPITVTGGHCWFLGGEADSLDDLRRTVRAHHKHGVERCRSWPRLRARQRPLRRQRARNAVCIPGPRARRAALHRGGAAPSGSSFGRQPP